VLLSDEAIFEEMMVIDRPWEYLHHRSYFRLPLHEVESRFSNLLTSDVCTVSNPSATTHLFFEGDMLVISRTIPINISRNKLEEPTDGLYLKKYFS